MTQKSWRVCPSPFLTIEEASSSKYIIISKVEKDFSDDILSFDEVGIHRASYTRSKTRPGVS